MAYESNDKEQVVSVVSLSNFSELRITVIKDSDTDELKAVDLRNWYCTQKDPEMKPTQKGVRLHKEDLAGILNTIISNLDEETVGMIKL